MTRLLIADDHPIIVSGLETVLRDTDFTVVGVVTDGNLVLDAVERLKPDILLLDVSMPGRNGIDIAGAIKKRGDMCRIVLLTAGVGDEGLLRALELGVDGIILKEDAPGSLLRRLEKVRSGGRAVDETLLQRALDLKIGSSGTAGTGFHALSRREQMVARQVAEGRRNREIGETLGISEGTVKVHLHKIYEKLGVGNRTELAILTRKASPQ